MRHILLAASFALIAGAAQAQSAGPSTDLSKAPSGPIPMETRHTEVLFSILHAGPVDYWGRFDKVAGDLTFDTSAPEKSSVSVTVDTGSVNFKAPELMKSVTAKEAFDSDEFPQATFKSTKITKTGPTTGTMTGDLTLKGITKPVTFAVTYNGAMPNSVGFHATATVKRSDFDMTGMRWAPAVSDDVKIIVEALFSKPRPPAP